MSCQKSVATYASFQNFITGTGTNSGKWFVITNLKNFLVHIFRKNSSAPYVAVINIENVGNGYEISTPKNPPGYQFLINFSQITEDNFTTIEQWSWEREIFRSFYGNTYHWLIFILFHPCSIYHGLKFLIWLIVNIII